MAEAVVRPCSEVDGSEKREAGPEGCVPIQSYNELEDVRLRARKVIIATHLSVELILAELEAIANGARAKGRDQRLVAFLAPVIVLDTAAQAEDIICRHCRWCS